MAHRIAPDRSAFLRLDILWIEYHLRRVFADFVQRVGQRSDIRGFLFALVARTESHAALFDRTEHVD
ncbi:hypothetical protein D3C75_1062320 [compost metagenome]